IPDRARADRARRLGADIRPAVVRHHRAWHARHRTSAAEPVRVRSASIALGVPRSLPEAFQAERGSAVRTPPAGRSPTRRRARLDLAVNRWQTWPRRILAWSA